MIVRHGHCHWVWTHTQCLWSRPYLPMLINHFIIVFFLPRCFEHMFSTPIFQVEKQFHKFYCFIIFYLYPHIWIVGPEFLRLWCVQSYFLKMPWPVWLSGLSSGLRTKGSLVQFPVRARAPGLQARSPVTGACKRQPHTDVSLPLSLSV